MKMIIVLVHLLSAIIIIIKRSGQKLRIHKDRSYKEILQQHKNLLTAPIVLVILALPRSILIFISQCMRTELIIKENFNFTINQKNSDVYINVFCSN